MKSKINRKIKNNLKACDLSNSVNSVVLFPEMGQTVGERGISFFAFCALIIPQNYTESSIELNQHQQFT